MFKRNPQLNKFNRAVARSFEKRCRVAAAIIERYEVSRPRLTALLAHGPMHSIGMESFRQALDACIVEDFIEVEA